MLIFVSTSAIGDKGKDSEMHGLFLAVSVDGAAILTSDDVEYSLGTRSSEASAVRSVYQV